MAQRSGWEPEKYGTAAKKMKGEYDHEKCNRSSYTDGVYLE